MGWSPAGALWLGFIFEFVAALLFSYECRHFVAFGYRCYPALMGIVFGTLLVALGLVATRRNVSGGWIIGVAVACYVGGLALAILSFPLNYLRSDMLPVILWADTHLLHHVSPYQLIYVGVRTYAFPYLPGMLVAYLPFVAAGLDLRFGAMLYVVATAALIFWTAQPERRREVAALLLLFLVSPFLQYRHELYLAPHWCALVLAFVLMQRRRFVWAAVAFGVSMAVYQFSWIMFPLFLLNGLRRKGWAEAVRLALLGAASALAVVGPFLKSASKSIASNTVGQWGLTPHATADPMNLSYWVTYVVHPDKLLRLQAAVMVILFVYCFVKGRCADFADTLRWMIVALTVFILLNVLVDGYFYLMLLVPMLVFTCVANGWWREPRQLTAAA